MVVVAVRTMLGQHRFLHSFGAVRSDGLANKALDEALKIFGVWTGLRTGLQMNLSGKNQIWNS
jgi:hypothetical protein